MVPHPPPIHRVKGSTLTLSFTGPAAAAAAMVPHSPPIHRNALAHILIHNARIRTSLPCTGLAVASEIVHTSLSFTGSTAAAAAMVPHPPAHSQKRSSSVVKCLWEVFVWGLGVLFLSCVCVSVSGVLFSVGVCVCVTC